MTVITDEQLAFLDQHRIPLSRVFDAKGMKRAEYQEAMRALDLVIAVGTSACKAAGHRMRTRAGHCAQCEPAAIAFRLRNDDPAFVYIAAPLSGSIIKVGSSQNPAQRIQTLNAFAYGGYRDWRLHFSEQCDRAGFIEFNAHRMMKPYSIPGFYKRGAVQVTCLELFSCGLSDAIAIVKNALANRGADSVNRAQVDLDERVARAPRTEPPSPSIEKEPAPKKANPRTMRKPAYARQSQPMQQATSPSVQARVTPDADAPRVAPPKKKTLSDYFWLAVWILPAITLLFVPGTFGHRLTTAFVVLVVQFPVGMISLLVLATVFKFLRGLGK